MWSTTFSFKRDFPTYYCTQYGQRAKAPITLFYQTCHMHFVVWYRDYDENIQECTFSIKRSVNIVVFRTYIRTCTY